MDDVDMFLVILVIVRMDADKVKCCTHYHMTSPWMVIHRWDRRHGIGTTHAPHTGQHLAPQSLVQSQGQGRKGCGSGQRRAWQAPRHHIAQVCNALKHCAHRHALSGCAWHYLQEPQKPERKRPVRVSQTGSGEKQNVPEYSHHLQKCCTASPLTRTGQTIKGFEHYPHKMPSERRVECLHSPK
jgi:hypothetical protein